MDEPLSNLDAKLRVSTRTQIAALQRRLSITTVYVTHDQVEAMTMGDRVAVLKDGVLQQVDTPRALYEAPANAFVAGFIGSPAMTLMRTTVRDGRAKIGNVELAAPGQGEILVGVRPESWRPTTYGLDVQVALVEELGADAYIYGTPTQASQAKTQAASVPITTHAENQLKIRRKRTRGSPNATAATIGKANATVVAGAARSSLWRSKSSIQECGQ